MEVYLLLGREMDLDLDLDLDRDLGLKKKKNSIPVSPVPEYFI